MPSTTRAESPRSNLLGCRSHCLKKEPSHRDDRSPLDSHLLDLRGDFIPSEHSPVEREDLGPLRPESFSEMFRLIVKAQQSRVILHQRNHWTFFALKTWTISSRSRNFQERIAKPT